MQQRDDSQRGGSVSGPAVSRDELVLPGSGADELLAALARWMAQAVPLQGLALWNGPADLPAPVRIAAWGAMPEALPALDAAGWAVASGACVTPAPGEIRLGLPTQEGEPLLLTARVGPDHVEAATARLRSALPLLMQRLPAALELLRLRQAVRQLEEAERLQRALFSIADLSRSELDMGEVLAAIHAIVSGLMYAENFYIALYDRERDALHFPYFRDAVDTDAPSPDAFVPMSDYEGSLTAHVLRTGQSLMGPSIELVRSIGAQPVNYGPLSADWMGVPLRRGEDVIGAVVVQSYDEQRCYTARERTLLSFVAQHIATALDRKLAHEELEARVAERTEALRAANLALQAEVEERQRGEHLQRALFRIAELGSTTDTLEQFYAAVHGVVAELLYAGNFYIALLSDDGGHIRFAYSVDEHDVARQPRALGHGLTEYVLRSGRPLLANRERIEQLAREGQVVSRGAMATVWMGVPLVCDVTTVGVLAVQSYDSQHRYTARDQELLTFVAFHIANALSRKRAAESLREANAALEQRVAERTEALAAANRDLREQMAARASIERRLKHDALHDALTGLPNRSHLMARMGDALRRAGGEAPRGLAVLFLDLDRFKVINDSVGHLVGDELLKEAARRIAREVGERGLVARLGGDEFAVLLEPLAAPDEAERVAEAVIAALSDPIRVSNKDLYTSTSVGIALGQPSYRQPEELLRDADVALYRAKAKGRQRYEIFDETLRREALERLEMEGNVRRGLARGEFEPRFQPILDLSEQRVVGYETLVRWRTPQGRLMMPGEFLPLAEESGLAEAIDWQVYEAAFARSAPLLRHGGFIGINMGARHFRDNQLVRRLLDLLQLYGMAPAQLRIEVTEGTLLEDPVQVHRLLEHLHALDIRVSLDDFGTGYSSLSYLHRFPLHAIKIDRSFVAPLGDSADDSTEAVLRAICGLASSLRLDVVAEGIETEAQADALRALGCGYGQGFLYAPALPYDELLARGLLPGARLGIDAPA